jgi:hypothetical protein
MRLGGYATFGALHLRDKVCKQVARGSNEMIKIINATNGDYVVLPSRNYHDSTSPTRSTTMNAATTSVEPSTTNWSSSMPWKNSRAR